MEKTSEAIMRRSLHIFLKNYQHFACTVAFIVLPFSASVLLSQSLQPSSSPFLRTIHSRLQYLFDAACFPSSSHFFSLLNLKLSQTAFSAIFTLPFTLASLLVAKAFIIGILHHHEFVPLFSYSLSLFQPILVTYLWNCFVLLSANAAAFSILFLAFGFLDVFQLSSPNTILFLSAACALVYSVIIANTLVVCNLAITVAGMESCSGFLAILKACVLIRGRAATALFLAMPTNLGLAAIEALFQYRVVRAYRITSGTLNHTFIWEVPLIAYIYSFLIILDTIMGCIFYNNCCRNNNYSIEDGCWPPIHLPGKAEDAGDFTKLQKVERLL